jgi:hypothetical protein
VMFNYQAEGVKREFDEFARAYKHGSVPLVGVYQSNNYLLATPESAMIRYKCSLREQEQAFECSVCLEKKMNLQALFSCHAHYFCAECCGSMVGAGINACPLCRAPIDEVEVVSEAMLARMTRVIESVYM